MLGHVINLIAETTILKIRAINYWYFLAETFILFPIHLFEMMKPGNLPY